MQGYTKEATFAAEGAGDGSDDGKNKSGFASFILQDAVV